MNRLILLAFACLFAHTVFSKTFYFQNDTVPPVVVCPANDTVVLAPGACSEIVNYAVEVSDDNPGVNLTQTTGLPSGATFPWGKTVNHFVATDAAGNTATCSFQVVLQQETYYNNCYGFVLVPLGDSCLAPLTLDMVLDETGSTLGCSTALVVQVKQNGTTGPFIYKPFFIEADAGKTYHFRVVDTLTGNSCWGALKVTGQLPDPVCSELTLPCILPNAHRAPAFLRDTFGLTAAFPEMPDNCGGAVQLTYTDAVSPGGCVDGLVEEIFRTWKATDTEGLTSTCVQRLEIKQVELQDVEFPDNTTYNLPCKNAWQPWLVSSSPFTFFQGKKYTVGSNSCNINGQQNDVLVALCEGTRRVTRIFTLLDVCTNDILIDSQYLLLPDLAGPAIHCDSVRHVQINASNCNVSLPWDPIAVTEHCSYTNGISVWWFNGTDTVRLQATIFNGGPLQQDTTGVFNNYSPFPIGETVVTYEATDACGNLGSCKQTVVVWDNAPPQLTCAGNGATVYLEGTGYRELKASDWVQSASDPCGEVAFKIRREFEGCGSTENWSDNAFVCCANIGDSVAFDIRAYDIPLPASEVNDTFGLGQFSSCRVTIVVADTASLQCKAPQDTVVTCLESPLSIYGNFYKSCVADQILTGYDFSAYDSDCGQGVVRRIFTVWEPGGASKVCSQTITVNGTPSNLAIRFPNDVMVTNCVMYGTPMHFGEPEILNHGCSNIEVTMQENIIAATSNGCYAIERNWFIRNRCFSPLGNEPLTSIPNPQPFITVTNPQNFPGPTLSAPGTQAPWTASVVKYHYALPPTDYSIFWSDSTAGYAYRQYIWINDENTIPEAVNCPTANVVYRDSSGNDPAFWSDSLFKVPARNFGVDRPEGQALITATAKDQCGRLSARCFLFFDLTGNSNQESVLSTNQSNLPRGHLRVNNGGIATIGSGTLVAFDKRAVPDEEKYKFVTRTVLVDTANSVWEAQLWWEGANGMLVTPKLPLGNHRIHWQLFSACGSTTECIYPISVRDGMPPALDCVDSLFRSLDTNGQAKITIDDVLLSPAMDNLSPNNKIILSLNKGVTTQFPSNLQHNPDSLLEYNCWSPTFQKGQLWAVDTAGNAGFCTFSLKVQDTEGVCNFGPVTLGGRLYTTSGQPIPDAPVYFDPQQPLIDASDTASNAGIYDHFFNISGVRFDIKPSRNHDPVNGVTTFDLVLINKHILDIEILDSPYKIIAADANGNRSVTTADIAVLRRLILGVQDTLPGQLSWRFVDSAYAFSNPKHPFAPPFAFNKSVYNPPGDQLWHHLIGVKIGDVNETAIVNVLQTTLDDRAVLPLVVNEQNLRQGEIVDIHLAPQSDLLASQFTLEFAGVEVLEIKPDAPLTTDHVVFFGEKNMLTFSNDAGGKTGLQIKLRATESGFLSEKIKLSDAITPAEAWTANSERLLPQLVFRKNEKAADLAAHPNVFTDQTVLHYHLPSDTQAELLVYNAAGQLLFQQSVPGTAGEHQFVLTASMVNHNTGFLAVQLRTGMETLSLKVVRQSR